MTSALMRRLVPAAGAMLLLIAVSAPAFAQDKKYKSITVRAPDGVSISAQEWGNPAGPEIVFIHDVVGAPVRQRPRQGVPHHHL